MTRKCQFLLGALFVMALSVQAQSLTRTPPIFPPALTNLVPPQVQSQSPVTFFRQLLAMNPRERINSLTNRPPEARERIMAKVHEYQALSPDERELRLRATELRWWLTPLLRLSPTNREPRLAQVPEDLRDLIQSRLTQWDILPPPLQQEFLESDRTLHYFARVEPTNIVAASAEQQKISEQFNQFFEFTPKEKEQTLATLSQSERAQMEKTLKTFEQLPAQQRMLCVRNYAKFAGMSNTERTEFLKNAEQWSKMSPQERQSWRDLVAHVPLLPPMPPPMVPPNLIPHNPTPKILKTSMATN